MTTSSVDSFMSLQSAWYVERFFTLWAAEWSLIQCRLFHESSKCIVCWTFCHAISRRRVSYPVWILSQVLKVHGMLNFLSHLKHLNGLSSSVDSFISLQSAWYVELFVTLWAAEWSFIQCGFFHESSKCKVCWIFCHTLRIWMVSEVPLTMLMESWVRQVAPKILACPNTLWMCINLVTFNQKLVLALFLLLQLVGS